MLMRFSWAGGYKIVCFVECLAVHVPLHPAIVAAGLLPQLAAIIADGRPGMRAASADCMRSLMMNASLTGHIASCGLVSETVKLLSEEASQAEAVGTLAAGATNPSFAMQVGAPPSFRVIL